MGTKTYLGDAVYAAWDDCDCIVFTTEDGISVTNRIVLEPEVYRALRQWVEQPHACAAYGEKSE